MNEMNNINILLWPNGHKREKAISLQINKNQINSLLSFKHFLINSALHNRRFTIDTINLYSHNVPALMMSLFLPFDIPQIPKSIITTC